MVHDRLPISRPAAETPSRCFARDRQGCFGSGEIAQPLLKSHASRDVCKSCFSGGMPKP